ncbi:MAG: 50S ribosomal protein L17 [candidate division Zixibacteria bacterium]|nr:50S ribosomal protein L17 [candidate division Zixibacteria bacterium]
MRHQDKVRKLNKTKPHREAMLSNMAASLLLHRIIKTTETKAKALRPVMDRLITIGKEDTLASKRRVAQVLRTRESFTRFYEEIIPKLGNRTSGYTRVIKAGVRRGDGSDMAIIELMIEKPAPIDPKVKKTKKEAKSEAAASATAPKKTAKKAASKSA